LSWVQDKKSVIHSTIWEDNAAALIMATSNPPHLTKWSKHIHVKYNWFREHLIPGVIKIKPIDTKNQLADNFTKALPMTLLTPIHKAVLKWSMERD
jgi:hypothetical protein